MTTVLTPAQAEYVKLPPRPLIPQQRIVNTDGTPTFEYNLFLTLQYEWARRLLAVMTGETYPRDADPPPASLEREFTRYGHVSAAGAISTPSPFTAAKLAVGKYRITLPAGFPAHFRVVATPEEAAGAARYAVFVAKTATTFDIWTYSGAAALIDAAFSFITIATE
jgi:hypothetical protein